MTKPAKKRKKVKTAAKATDRSTAADMADALIAAHGGDLTAAEKAAGRMVDYRASLPLLALGLLLPLVGIFMPHSGEVRGFDVLFDTQTARIFATTRPEEIFAWLQFTALSLTVGTIVSKEWLVAWVNWAFAGVAWWYSIIAIWMRQSRPEIDPGTGPSYGLIMCSVGLTILFLTLCGVVMRKNVVQRAIAQARREAAHQNEESRLAQQRLRAGLVEREAEPIIDDRRARARRKQRD